MRASIPRSFSAQTAVAPAVGNATLVMTGAELLLSMVEARWTARNGDGSKMDSGLKAQQELGKIEQQLAKLQSVAGQTDDIRRQIQQLNERINTLRKQVSAHLSAWEKTELARHPQRPYTLDYIERIFTDWSEIHGDRGYADDPAIICGMARFHGDDVMVIGHQKARDTKQKVYRNFGMPNPEGYRKALRAMKIAEKFHRPIFTFVDTPGAYPGLGAEERGQAEAIARNLREMARLHVPVITTITGEGGSGGALAIAVAEDLAAQALRITPTDLNQLGCIDGIVPEPEGGAHLDHEAAAAFLDAALAKHMQEVSRLSIPQLLESRYEKFRHMAQFLRVEA